MTRTIQGYTIWMNEFGLTQLKATERDIILDNVQVEYNRVRMFMQIVTEHRRFRFKGMDRVNDEIAFYEQYYHQLVRILATPVKGHK